MAISPEVSMGLEVERKLSIPEIKREIFEAAGRRTPEQIRGLISQVESILVSERERGQGKLKDTIEQIKTGPNSNEYFVDQNVTYLPEKGNAVFIGDIHGDAEAVVSIIEQTRFIENMEKGDKSQRLVFLGDYADRGAKDIETLEMVLDLKARYPDNVILLRGNHEQEDIGRQDGLYRSLRFHEKIGFENVGPLFEKYNKMFEKLPAVCLTGNGIVALHGGIPSREVSSLRDLNNPDLLKGIRWNDPNPNIPERAPNIGRTGGDVRLAEREGTYSFGQKAFERFMSTVGGKVMVRGHEVQERGLRSFFGNRLVSLFSTGRESPSSGYKDRVSEARFMKADLSRPVKISEEGRFQKIEYGRPAPERRERVIELRGYPPLALKYKGEPIGITLGDKPFILVDSTSVKRGDVAYGKPFLLIEPGRFNPDTPQVGYKGIGVGETVEIGRKNPHRFDLPETVSSEHLRLNFDGERFRIEDLNSRNGTRVIVRETAR